MGQRYVVCLSLALSLLGAVTSQIVWINQDTGEILGVSPSGNRQQPQRQGPPYGNRGVNGNQHGNHGGNSHPVHPPRGNPHQGQQNLPNQLPEFSNPNAEWVCKNRGGDTMILATDAGNRGPNKPGQQQTMIHNPTQQIYDHNPWLMDQNPKNSGKTSENVTPPTPPVTVKPPPPPPPTNPTPAPTRKPFPTFDNVDWTQFLETTTQKPSTNNLVSAISGEGIIEPRQGVVH